jgi:tetratricopeptide (TPR) repeat protein
MKAKKSDAWVSAEYRYSEIHAMQSMSFFGESMSPDEVTKELARIVKSCPTFYPAVIELGIRKLVDGAGETETKRILKGVQLMLELGGPKHLVEEVDALIDNLENLWRYDVAERCLELLVEHDPENPTYRDYLAHSMSKLGKIDAALEQSRQAVAMAPRNGFFRSNLGFFHSMNGDADEARKHFKAALKLDPSNEAARNNLEIADYIARYGGNLASYLVRPLDRERMEHLEDEEEYEELGALTNSYNADRMTAFGMDSIRDKARRSRCADTISTLMNFFDFVDRVANMGEFLNEDIGFVHEHFNAIMHKFIFKFRDVDRQMIDDICQSLLDYYGFLSRSGVVPTDLFQEFQTLVQSQRETLIDKTIQYNAIRHDGNLDEDEKEAIREELFHGDHAWPHL